MQMFSMLYLLLVLLLSALIVVCPYVYMQMLANLFIDPTCENLSTYQEAWEKMGGNFIVHTTADLDAAMSLAIRLGAKDVLITGSLYLVGHALQLLQPHTA